MSVFSLSVSESVCLCSLFVCLGVCVCVLSLCLSDSVCLCSQYVSVQYPILVDSIFTLLCVLPNGTRVAGNCVSCGNKCVCVQVSCVYVQVGVRG